MDTTDTRSLTPSLPEYPVAHHFLRILNGVSYTLYRSLYNSIWEQRGNPQETVNWTTPEVWIVERLEGQEQELALRIWRESRGALNPRYLRGSWYLSARHDLLCRDSVDILTITEKGRNFWRTLPARSSPASTATKAY